MALMAYFLNSWRILQLTLSVVTLLLIVPWFFTSESPRWLLSKKKHTKFINLMIKASKKNEKTIKTSSLILFETENENSSFESQAERNESLKYRSLFERPQIVLTITLMILWPITAMGYYGITLSMSDLAGDAFWSNALSALMELPSYVFLVLLMDKTGRKPLLVFSLFFTSVTCLGAALSVNQVLLYYC